jgi:hypothetical protein
MYEKRTPSQSWQSPLTDISFYGKNPQNTSYTEGSVSYRKTVAVNMDGDIQDLNQSCGFWSDYIYLIKHYSVEAPLGGSIIGTGSILVISLLLITSLCVGFYAIKKNKKEADNTKKSNDNKFNSK